MKLKWVFLTDFCNTLKSALLYFFQIKKYLSHRQFELNKYYFLEALICTEWPTWKGCSNWGPKLSLAVKTTSLSLIWFAFLKIWSIHKSKFLQICKLSLWVMGFELLPSYFFFGNELLPSYSVKEQVILWNNIID